MSRTPPLFVLVLLAALIGSSHTPAHAAPRDGGLGRVMHPEAVALDRLQRRIDAARRTLDQRLRTELATSESSESPTVRKRHAQALRKLAARYNAAYAAALERIVTSPQYRAWKRSADASSRSNRMWQFSRRYGAYGKRLTMYADRLAAAIEAK